MSSDQQQIGERMKEYENVTRYHLSRRTPTIIRVDGRAFHTFTKTIADPSLERSPFSEKFNAAMVSTAECLFHSVQNAVFVYTQSDEISILLRDWDNRGTQQWFNGTIQKICSLSASIATAEFNDSARVFLNQTRSLAHFDARVFQLPKEEVTNYFIWRQQDAIRNSVQMYARFFYSHKQVTGLSNQQLIDLIDNTQESTPWSHLPVWMRHGVAISKGADQSMITDRNLPRFVEDRKYVEQYITAQGDVNDSST